MYIYPLLKIHEEMPAMFWRKKKTAWYWKVLLLLIILRILYAFARFFMKVTDKHAGSIDKSMNKNRK